MLVQLAGEAMKVFRNRWSTVEDTVFVGILFFSVL